MTNYVSEPCGSTNILTCSALASLGCAWMWQSCAEDLPSQNTLFCSPPFILPAWHCTGGFKGCEMYVQSRMLPQTSLDGRQGGLFTHSFSPYGPISLTHSLCQQAFMDLELTLLLLCCIMSLLVIEFLLDWMKGFSSSILNGFQVRIAL